MRRQSELMDEVLVTRFIEPPAGTPASQNPDTLFVVSNGVNGLEWDAVQRAKILAGMTGNLTCAMLRPGTGGTVTDKATLRELRNMSTYDLTNRMADVLCYRLSKVDNHVNSLAFIDSSAAAKQAIDLATMASLPVSMLGLFDPVDRLNLESQSSWSRLLPGKLCQDVSTARGVLAWRKYKNSEPRAEPGDHALTAPDEPKRPPFLEILRTEVTLYGHRWSTGHTRFNLGSIATEARIPTYLTLPLNTFNGTPDEVMAEAHNLRELHDCVTPKLKQPFVVETPDIWHNALDQPASYADFAASALWILSRKDKDWVGVT